MKRRGAELWLAAGTVAAITAGYAWLARSGAPRAGDVVGHALGIVGFVLMLVTETAYSLRKRSERRVVGRMSTWLAVHVYTGIVGPFLVLLHTAWDFRGLAGLVTWMTALVVVSGFVGRYIYTAVPRTVDGLEPALTELEEKVAQADERLRTWLAGRPAELAAVTTRLLQEPEAPHRDVVVVLGRALLRWGHDRHLRRESLASRARVAPRPPSCARSWASAGDCRARRARSPPCGTCSRCGTPCTCRSAPRCSRWPSSTSARSSGT